MGLDENKSFGPVRPDPPKQNPEQPIGSMQLQARLLALIDRKLLPKSYCLQRQNVAGNHKTPASTPAWLTGT
jgi:hypothetical protein